MENKDIGFVRENVFYAWMQGDMGVQSLKTVRTQLLGDPNIEGVPPSQLPIDIGNSTSG